MFWTVPLSIIRSFSLYTQQWYMPANLYDIYHCCVYSEKLLMMDTGTVRNMQFHSKNKIEKLVHLVGFITSKFNTMHGHMNIKYLMYLTGITMNKENSSDFMFSQVPWSQFWSYHYSDMVMLLMHTSNHVHIHNIHKITCRGSQMISIPLPSSFFVQQPCNIQHPNIQMLNHKCQF